MTVGGRSRPTPVRGRSRPTPVRGRSRPTPASPPHRAQARSHRVLPLLLLLLPLIVEADYQSGLDAYNAGDYATALHEWKAAASTPPGATIPATDPATDSATVPGTDPATRAAIMAETHYAIGMLYWTGRGVTRDYFAAANWMHQAARLNHAGAQVKLGYLYAEGITVAQDYQRAFQWFSKAARQGDVDGQYNLGIFYLNGWGTEQNKTMAAQYLAAASAQGDEAAEEKLQTLLSKRPLAADPCKSPLAADPCKRPLAADHSSKPDRAQARSHSYHSHSYHSHSYHSDSYHSHSYSWILSQNPEHYTIQVIALRSLAKLHSLIAAYDYLAPFATYRVELKGRPLYVLVQGVYPEVESAREARDKFPRAINRPARTWIRQFGKIQAIIRAAQQAADE